jgi:TM2 domain-containing membrane protein YozV
MNCAIHPEIPAAAFCRTCGKALCETCKRDVKGVIYCEDCIAAQVQGTIPPQQQTASTAPAQPFAPSAGLAGVLAGIFPFGIGQVYNRQYGKGFAYMLTFALLVWAAANSGSLAPFIGITIGFYYFYQIIDAVRSAQALRMGEPAPDPFGLNRVFGFSDDHGKWSIPGAPIGAIILIGLGILFLLSNFGWFEFFHIGRFWPLVLIALGVGLYSQHHATCPCIRCRCAGLMGPAVLVTLGILFQLSTLDVKGFWATWPLLLIVIGVVKVLQTSGPTSGHIGPDTPSESASQGVQNV